MKIRDDNDFSIPSSIPVLLLLSQEVNKAWKSDPAKGKLEKKLISSFIENIDFSGVEIVDNNVISIVEINESIGFFKMQFSN